MNLYLIIIIFFLINFLFLSLLNKLNLFLNIVDHKKNKIKNFKRKIYLTGGFVFYLNFVIYIFLVNTNVISEENIFFSYNQLLFFSSLVFILGVVDDKYTLSYYSKTFFLIIIFSLLIFFDNSLQINKLRLSFLGTVPLNEFGPIFTIFCVYLFVNAFNLFDGINLQCGLYTLTLSFFCVIFLNLNLFYVFILSCLIFLRYNLNNKLYLGDNGSLFISFIFSYIFIKSYNHFLIDTEIIFILMSVPGLDMLRVFISRLILKKNPFLKDRLHLHHLLLNKLGLAKTNLIIQGLIVLQVAFYKLKYFNSIILIFIISIIYLILINYAYKTK